MSNIDTGTETCERLAAALYSAFPSEELREHVAATLRAIAAERDALNTKVRAMQTTISRLNRAAEQDRTRFVEVATNAHRLAAENAKLREALADLMTWFPDKPSAPEWRLPGGKYGADDAVEAARAALAGDTDAK